MVSDSDTQTRAPSPTAGSSAWARVCVSLSDTVVGLQGAGDRVPPERIHLYEGRHEPFTAADRTAATGVVTEALSAAESGITV